MLMLSDAELIALARAGLLMLPLLLAAALLLVTRPNPREATACMVAFLWQIPALLLLHVLAGLQGWWTFAGARHALMGLPIDVWIGWAVWWGPVAVLALRFVRLPLLVALFVAIDFLAMPLLAPLVVLGDRWWIGEGVAVALCLLPALAAAWLTRTDAWPGLRATFHILGWGGFLVLVIPAAALTYEGGSLADFLRVPVSLADWLLAAAAAFLLFIGIAATMEFARIGQGTPIPFDPPKRVVSSGPYAFTANPMQIISALVVFLFALYAASWALAIVALAFATFDAIYARWYNTAHIAHAMPQDWKNFSGEVPEWRLRWRPFVEGEAEVLISRDGPTRWIWDRLWARACDSMSTKVSIRDLAPEDGRRLRYRRPAAGIDETGTIAAARVLEHGPLPFALVGWLLRFPGLSSVLQLSAGCMIRLYRGRRAIAG
jgi:Phospholipid methyltransferase